MSSTFFFCSNRTTVRTNEKERWAYAHHSKRRQTSAIIATIKAKTISIHIKYLRIIPTILSPRIQHNQEVDIKGNICKVHNQPIYSAVDCQILDDTYQRNRQAEPRYRQAVNHNQHHIDDGDERS